MCELALLGETFAVLRELFSVCLRLVLGERFIVYISRAKIVIVLL